MTLGLGCDFVGGVTRYAELEVPLTPECVRRGLEQAGGVSDIRYHAPDYSSTYHRFDYRVAGLDNSLLFEHRFGYGATRYWHEYSRLNAAPPQAEVDRIRPQLARIDASIGRECGVPELPSQMAEDCRGVECKAPD
ncbi:MAG: hypothetical protein U0271_44450 [Polyangiaceae bacterium]